MAMTSILRILGIIINALAACVLAWRVKSILDMLIIAQNANDINFRVLIELLNGNNLKQPIITGMNKQVEKQQKQGVWLLVIGFSLMAIGNVLIGLSWYFDA